MIRVTMQPPIAETFSISGLTEDELQVIRSCLVNVENCHANFKRKADALYLKVQATESKTVPRCECGMFSPAPGYPCGCCGKVAAVNGDAGT